jgi:hypothetical protein
MVLPDIFYMARKLESNADDEARGRDFLDLVYGRLGKKPQFNIRTMRITSYATQQIEKKWQQRKKAADLERNARYPASIELSVKSEKQMPTIDEISDQFFSDTEEKPAILYRQDHVIGYPILGFFATKIQDNLPAAILKSRLTPLGLEPLVQQSDIRTPWKSLSNKD